ncbi:unnamed protein product [Caenorhabditis brenneri]
MDFLHLPKVQRRYLRYPACVYEDLESKQYFMPAGETECHESWVTARFSTHWSQENILYMGDDPGNIGIFDVRKFHDRTVPLTERQLHFFPAHDGAIMDIVTVPNKETHIISISGDSTIRCWDLTQASQSRESQMFFGHECSVRSISFAPDNPNVFVTGSRDRQVKIWDMRVSTVKKMEEDCRLSTITYKTPHPKLVEKPISTGTPKSKGKTKIDGHKVTSVVFLNEHHIASASENASSGIRVWDIRKPTRNGEGQPTRVLNVPTSNKKSYGVTCLTKDRFSNRLFASCTDSSIFEYSIPTESITPINSYTGATIHNFYTQVACSPVSDIIACGSEDGRAVIWDLQNQYKYMNDRTLPYKIGKEEERRRAKPIRWSLGGHQKQVLNVGWSSRGKYFMSCDEGGVRIWKEPEQTKAWKLNDEDDTPYPETQQELGLAYECAKPFETKESDEAMSCSDSIFSSPTQQPDLGSVQKKRGLKRPIVESSSPGEIGNSSSGEIENSDPVEIESSCPKELRLNLSPRAKKQKLSSPPPAPWSIEAQGFTFKNIIIKKPTVMLPNFVYDTFVKKMLGEASEEESGKSLTKTGRKRIEDWWQEKGENVPTVTRMRLPSVSEFGESACSKVLTEEERTALHSPRKLIVRKSVSPCKPVTPSNPLPLKAIPMTPRKPTNKRPTSRNLFHYFKK